MEREDNPPPVRMFHFDVAAFAVDFNEAHPLECRQNLPSGQERQLHKTNSTTSRFRS